MVDKELETIEDVEEQERYDSEAILDTDDWDDGLMVLSADSTIRLLDEATPLPEIQTNGTGTTRENGHSGQKSVPDAVSVIEPEPVVGVDEVLEASAIEPEQMSESVSGTTVIESEPISDVVEPHAGRSVIDPDASPAEVGNLADDGVTGNSDSVESMPEDPEVDNAATKQPMSAAAAKKLGVAEVTTRAEDGLERRARPPRRRRRTRTTTRQSRHFNSDNPPESTTWDDVQDGQIPYVSPQAPISRKFENYIETRWYPQWKFYDERASHSKSRYIRYQVFIALGSVTVPIIIGFNFVPQWIPAVISGLVAAAAAIENVMKYGDNWRAYRAAAEGLNREKVLYEAMSGPYGTATAPLRMFVERCEDVIAEETGRFVERNQDPMDEIEHLESDVMGADE